MTKQQISAPLARLWQGVGHAMRERAARRQLGQLDDRMLQDLGISRAQATFEAGRHGGSVHDGAWVPRSR
ncbi:MAG TPA: DUF1127 domain-containing protein [Acetobacteraceae bacterium]|nr:DUF1127 domain-containing protein [Acetobacteraceae bacterium]